MGQVSASICHYCPFTSFSDITVVVEKKDAPWIPMLTNELHTLHNCNCDVIEFKEVDLSCLQDQRCQCVYALIQRGDPTSDKLLDDFIDRLPPDVASKKLLSARFGVSEVDKSATGDESTTSRSISYTDQLDVEAAAKCAAMLHDAHPCCRVSRPPPLCIADLSDVLHDRSLSATPPGSATQLLEDSGCSSLTNSDQNTPNTQHRSQHHNFPKDQSSLLLTALVKAHHIGEQAKELKLNTRYLGTYRNGFIYLIIYFDLQLMKCKQRQSLNLHFHNLINNHLVFVLSIRVCVCVFCKCFCFIPSYRCTLILPNTPKP